MIDNEKLVKPNKRELVKIGQWLLDGDTGLSSLALASFYLTAGNGGECASRLETPSDPSDFGRCVKFLENCIDKNHQHDLIYAIGQVTKNWKRVQDEWFVLMKLYDEEKNQTSAPKLYKFMKKIGL